MRRKFVLLALNYPGLKLLLLRRTHQELKENHVLPLQQELYGFATYRDTDKSFTFPNGSRIKLGYCDAEADVYQYQGQEYDVIGLEEATHFTESQKDFLTTSNRTTRDDFSPRMYYTMNPGGIGHSWVKRLFIDRDYRNKERAEDYTFIQANVYDNKILLERNPEYIEALENLPEELRKAHLYGDWDVFAGQFFREFRRDLHVIKPFEIPSTWRKFRSIDYGYNDHTSVLWYAVHDGHVYVYRELHINMTLASEIARQIVDLSGNEKIDYTVASPDMWQTRGATDKILGENIAETFMNHGVPLVKADNARIIGWNRVREYLAPSYDGIPNLQIFENVSNLTYCLPKLMYDERKAEDAATEPHELTDACITGDTIVNTVEGDIPIRDLVGKEGLVYCYDVDNECKDVKQFSDVRMTREQADIFELELEDGRTIRLTDDHKVLTDSGWKEAKYLTEADYIIDILV